MCQRYYRRFSSDYRIRTGETDRSKIQEFQIEGTVGQYQMEDRENGRLAGFFNINPQLPQIIDYSLKESGEPIYISDCINNWCRFEQCMVGDFDNGLNIEPVARFTQILNDGSIGKELLMTRPSNNPLLNTNTTVKLGNNVNTWIANLYREGNLTGETFVSHAMMAAWPDNSGQFIGPACEVEGGCDGEEPPEQPGSEPSNGNGESSNGNGGSSNGGGTSVASNLTPGDNGSEEAYEGEAEEIINLTTPPEKEEPTRFIDIFKDNQLLSIIVIILLILTLLVIYWVVKYYKRPARKRSRKNR